jgi:hypothetical protein
LKPLKLNLLVFVTLTFASALLAYQVASISASSHRGSNPGLTAQASLSTLILAPAFAGFCAFVGSQVNNLKSIQNTLARSTFKVGSSVSILLATGGTLIIVAIYGVISLSSQVNLQVPDVQIIVLCLLGIYAFSIIGFALGLRSNRLAALAIAPILPLITYLVPLSFEPFWLRYLAGFYGPLCCDAQSVLDSRAVLSSFVFLFALSTAVTLEVSNLAPKLRRPIVTVLIVFGLVGAQRLAFELGPLPVVFI